MLCVCKYVCVHIKIHLCHCCHPSQFNGETLPALARWLLQQRLRSLGWHSPAGPVPHPSHLTQSCFWCVPPPPLTSHRLARFHLVMDSPLEMYGYFWVCWFCVALVVGSYRCGFHERRLEALPCPDCSRTYPQLAKADLTRDRDLG